MNNQEIFAYVAIGAVLLVGSYAMVLAVMLDRAKKLIEKQKAEIARMVLPPF